MSDLISRQALIDELWRFNTSEDRLYIDSIVDIVENLPPAEPEVVKVKVMKDLNDKPVFVCECGAYLEGETFWKIAENYCPNCGRRLEWNEAENERPYQ